MAGIHRALSTAKKALSKKGGKRRIAGVLSILLVSLLAVAVLSGLYLSTLKTAVQDDGAIHLQEISRQMRDNAQNVFQENKKILTTLAHALSISEPNSLNQAQPVLGTQQRIWGYTHLGLLNAEGQWFREDGVLDSPSFPPEILRTHLDKQQVAALASLPSQDNLGEGEFTDCIVFSVPISLRFWNFEACALTAVLDISEIQSILSMQSFGGESLAYLVDSQGKVILHAEDREDQIAESLQMELLSSSSPSARRELDRVFQNMKEGGGGSLIYPSEGKNQYMSYEPLGMQGWYLVTVVPVDVMNRTADYFISLSIYGCVCIALILFGLGAALYFRARKRDQAKGEKEIEFREQMFSTLSENIRDIFLLYDCHTKKLDYISSNTQRLLGVDPDAVLGDYTLLKERFRPEDSEEILQQIEHWDGKGVLAQECLLSHQATGQGAWFLCQVTPLPPSGRPEKYIITLSDRTEENRNRRKLQDALSQAEKASRSKSVFLSKISHEIRTPMNGIMGMTAIARLSLDDRSKLLDCLNKVETSAQFLLSLFNDILDMSRIENGSFGLTEGIFSFPQLVEGMRGMMEFQAQEKGVDFQVKIGGVPRNALIGDALRLNQILMNLLSNAIRFTETGGRVLLEAEVLEEAGRAPGGSCTMRFVVSDTGIGMSGEFLSRIFQPFEQDTVPAGDVQGKGPGLGLSICRNLVQLMKGEITVSSTLGKGSRFTVVIPAGIAGQDLSGPLKPEAPCGGGGSPPAAQGRLQGMRILLAEDNELNAEIAVTLLEMAGAETVTAQNGKAAVEQFQLHMDGPSRFDLILMDLQMPEMGGLEAAQAIRSLESLDSGRRSSDGSPAGDFVRNRIPILAMTANAFQEDRENAAKSGMDGLLPKPFDLEQLYSMLTQYQGRT